jgi:hypothetical protein
MRDGCNLKKLLLRACDTTCFFFCLDTKDTKSQDGTYYPDATAGIFDPHVPSNSLMKILCYCG